MVLHIKVINELKLSETRTIILLGRIANLRNPGGNFASLV